MRRKSILSAILSVTVAISLAGCGGGSSSSYKADAAMENYSTAEADYDSYTDDVYDYSYEEAAEEAIENGEVPEMATEEVKPQESSRKIIKTVNINAETEDFDKFIANITNKVEALGGYLENTDISGRSINSSSDYLRNANITARIPSPKLDDFVTNVTDNSNITNKSESAEDVTLGYADTKAHVSSLRTEQNRLNELIKEADNIDTLLILEKRLTEVRYEIESYESRLRTMDNKVDYSTVYLRVSEVRKYTPVVTEKQTFSQRVAQGFSESLANVIEGVVDFIAELIIAIPYIVVLLLFLAIFALIIFLVIKVIIKLIKKLDEKQQKKYEAERQRRAAMTNRPVNNAVNQPDMAQNVNNVANQMNNAANQNGDIQNVNNENK